jgi:hypothetical protein
MVMHKSREAIDAQQSALAVQPGGSHYKSYVIQPVEFITLNKVPFIEGNVIKYIMRHRQKNGLEDLQKARHYIDLLIEIEYSAKQNNDGNKG